MLVGAQLKILLIGGSGILGTELQKLDPYIEAPSHKDFDITDQDFIWDGLKSSYDLIINCAAIKDEKEVVEHPRRAISTNIIGSANLAMLCVLFKMRYVYISTDYVYPCEVGDYSEHSDLNPRNNYAWSKLGGEASARIIPNSLIIRTSFFGHEFPYNVAYMDKYTSKGYVYEIAPKILKAAKSDITGIINIGMDRKSVYDIARQTKINVESDSNSTLPRDSSMNLGRYKRIFE